VAARGRVASQRVIEPQTHPRVPFPALLAWAGFWVAAPYAVTLGGGFEGIYGLGLRSMSLVIIADGPGLWAIATLRSPLLRPRSSIRPAFVLPLLALRRNDDFDERAQLDLDYIDRWSLWLDFKILARTIPAALEGR
jgi:hypothetical protein